MLTRLLIFNKLKKHNDSIRKQNAVNLANLAMLNADEDAPMLKEGYKSLSQQIRKMESRMEEREQYTKAICDIGDILFLSIIAQVILMIKGFDIGVMIAQFISLIAVYYGYKTLKYKDKVLSTITIFTVFTVGASILMFLFN